MWCFNFEFSLQRNKIKTETHFATHLSLQLLITVMSQSSQCPLSFIRWKRRHSAKQIEICIQTTIPYSWFTIFTVYTVSTIFPKPNHFNCFYYEYLNHNVWALNSLGIESPIQSAFHRRDFTGAAIVWFCLMLKCCDVRRNSMGQRLSKLLALIKKVASVATLIGFVSGVIWALWCLHPYIIDGDSPKVWFPAFFVKWHGPFVSSELRVVQKFRCQRTW